MTCRGVIESSRIKLNSRLRRFGSISKESKRECIVMKCSKCSEQPSIIMKNQRLNTNGSRKKIGISQNYRCRLTKYNRFFEKLRCSEGKQLKFSPFISQITETDLFSLCKVGSLYYYGFKHRSSHRKENLFPNLHSRV